MVIPTLLTILLVLIIAGGIFEILAGVDAFERLPHLIERILHTDVAALSSSLRRVPVQTNHAVMFEQPDVIVQAVHELLNRPGP
jgi:hypothetical protein